MTIWAAILIVISILFVVCAAFFFGYAVGIEGGRKMSKDEIAALINQILQEQSKCEYK